MAKNNRIPVKWVRDRAKSAYEKQNVCAICATTVDLELHHLYSVTWLLETWAARKNYDISTDSGILAVRDEFIAEHHRELYEQVYTLCNPHHVALHAVYGKSPSPTSVAKQERWIAAQKAKYSSEGYVKTPSYGSFFSGFTQKG
jgi:hypothetical protein